MEVNEEKKVPTTRARDHMANERTFLAWIRTSIGIMAFGFVLERFALFIKEVTAVFGEAKVSPHSTSYSSIFGVILVALGALIGLLAFIKFKSVEKAIDDESYHTPHLLPFILTAAVVLTGIFLVIYLLST